jgi:hypothetical protein
VAAPIEPGERVVGQFAQRERIQRLWNLACADLDKKVRQ